MRIILGIIMSLTLLLVGCSKQPLTLDENTSMKTLLKASDKEITELVMKEIEEKMDMSSEDVSIEYILRDNDSQSLAVKVKIKNNWPMIYIWSDTKEEQFIRRLFLEVNVIGRINNIAIPQTKVLLPIKEKIRHLWN